MPSKPPSDPVERPEPEVGQVWRHASGVEYVIQNHTQTAYTQAYGCWFCLHVGSTAIYFGSGVKGRGPRIELCTPMRWFRYSRGYRENSQ